MAQLPASLVAPIRHIAKRALGKDWQLYGLLLDHWPTIVGEAWAELIHPVKLAFPAATRPGAGQALRDGVLTLRMPRGLAMEVQYQQPQIIARINNFFGASAVSRLNFMHSGASPRPTKRDVPALSPQTLQALHAATAVIADAALREALESLGTHVHRNPGMR